MKKSSSLLSKAFKSSFLEFTFRPIEPLLVFICAGIYVGGEWGEFKVYESFAFVLYRICSFGFGAAVTWYQPQVPERQFVRSVFQICIFSFISCLIFIFLILTLNAYYPDILAFFNKGFNNGNRYKLLLFLFATPFMVCTEVLLSACITYKKFLYFGFIQFFLRPILIFLPPIIAYFWFFRLDLSFSFFWGSVITFILSFIAFFTTIPIQINDLTWKIIPCKKILKYSYPLALSQWISVFSTRIDIFMLAGISSLQQVEVYSIALTISKSLNSIVESLAKFLHYLFSSQKLSGVTEKLKDQFNYATWVVTTIQTLLFIIFIIFGKFLLELINSEYTAGYSVILIVTLFLYINSHFNFISTVLINFGKTHIFLVLITLGLLTNFLFNTWLIPLYDSNGAAIALGISSFINSLITFFAVYYYFKKNIFSFKLIKGSLTSIFTIISVYVTVIYLTEILFMKIMLIIFILILFLMFKYQDYRKIKVN